jgi:hypothetical protein
MSIYASLFQKTSTSKNCISLRGTRYEVNVEDNLIHVHALGLRLSVIIQPICDGRLQAVVQQNLGILYRLGGHRRGIRTAMGSASPSTFSESQEDGGSEYDLVYLWCIYSDAARLVAFKTKSPANVAKIIPLKVLYSLQISVYFDIQILSSRHGDGTFVAFYHKSSSVDMCVTCLDMRHVLRYTEKVRSHRIVFTLLHAKL